MSNIRKIKANSAVVDGRYVHVERHSLQPLGAIIGSIVGLLIVFITSQDIKIDGITIIIILISTFLFAASFPGKVTRDIPEGDVVEIKRYPGEDRVTVVLDDQRTQRQATPK